MAETAASLQALIDTIDTKIANITNVLGDATTGAKYTEHKIGNIEVDGSQQLEQLLKTRELYQKRLDVFPSEVVKDTPYEIDVTGRDFTDYIGDE